MKRKLETTQETSIKKIKSDNVPGHIKKNKTKAVSSGDLKSKKAGIKNGDLQSKKVVIKKEVPDLDITQSLTDTGHSKSKKFRFEKSGGKKAGKFKKAEAPKKPNWNEYKKKKKDLQKKRKMSGNSNYDVMVESKKIWEQVRRADCAEEKKSQLLLKLHRMLKDKMSQIVFSHDMSRIIQWLLKLSPAAMRKEITAELLPLTVQMIKCKYSNALVKHMLKSSDEATRNDVIKTLVPHVVDLLSHTTAAPILTYAHDQVATPAQKLAMRQELYGGLYQSAGDVKINCLEDIFKQSPEMKPAILSVTKKTILKSLQKEHVTSSALLHAVLLDFISHSADSPDLTEVLEMLAPLPILQFVHSKPGASVAMHIIWNATNKLKKQIVKELKGHVREVACSEFGHLALVTLLDNVDDTLLLKKALLGEFLANIEAIASNEYGRRVTAHCVNWGDPGFFHPSAIQQVKAGDDFSTRKKDRDIRNKEILEAVSESLLESIAQKPDFWLGTSSVAMVTAVILNHVTGPRLKDAFDSVAKVIVDINRTVPIEVRHHTTPGGNKKKQKIQKDKAEDSEDTGETDVNSKKKKKQKDDQEDQQTPFIEHAGFHTVLKKLLLHDRENVTKELPTLSESIVSSLTEEVLDRWTQCNRACFILTLIFESGMEDCASTLKSKLSPYRSQLSTQKIAGAKVLLKKLD